MGKHSALLSCRRTGSPLAKTFVDAIENKPVTQGPFPPGGGGIAQPATWYGAVINTTGWPPTRTRGNVADGVAIPPCAHFTIELKLSKNPGISLGGTGRLACHLPPITPSAPPG